ncbi:MAG: D-alanyl-D-alanine carboxypeptidase family protein [Acidimicrobiaceae bacterium]|nr:D-alanyl-D-alanine carboxypeptidase family protein [Acidimicrobiaceae bacterium]
MTERSPCRSFPLLRQRRWLGVLGVLLMAAAASGPAAAQSDEQIIEQSRQIAEDRKAERQELQQVAADATENLDAATADAAELIDALNKVQAAVDTQQDALNEAERAVADAEAVVAEAETRITELEEELLSTEERLRRAVVESYVSFQAPTGSLSVLGADPWENAREEALAGFATGSGIDDLDDLRRLGEELERWRIQAAEAAAEAEVRRREANLVLADLLEAVDREAALSVEAEERVDRRLVEVQLIRELDAELAAEIEAAEREIISALARQRAAEEARRRAEEEARRKAEEEARRIAEEAGRAPEPVASVTPDGINFELANVRGFVVNAQIADDVDGLLEALEAAGFDMGGWGYRTHQRQIELRRAHCGTSDWAVWQKPSSTCRPPTARPGRSNHEKGLAIDFTESGRLITSRSSAVFRALQRLAPQFGLQNLPSEPWHWSVDGR